MPRVDYSMGMIKLIRTSALLLTALFLFGFATVQTQAADNAAKKTVKTELIDVNSATADVLRTLPGIGEAYAAKIIQNRPYTGKDQIVSKAGVPQATYDKIKDKIIAKQAAKKGAGKKK